MILFVIFIDVNDSNKDKRNEEDNNNCNKNFPYGSTFISYHPLKAAKEIKNTTC